MRRNYRLHHHDTRARVLWSTYAGDKEAAGIRARLIANATHAGTVQCDYSKSLRRQTIATTAREWCPVDRSLVAADCKGAAEVRSPSSRCKREGWSSSPHRNDIALAVVTAFVAHRDSPVGCSGRVLVDE